MKTLDIILACREFRCAWNHEAAWFVVQGRDGARVWERRADCLRGCGSERIDRVRPTGLFEPIGRPRYERSQDWHESRGVYMSVARRERLRRQFGSG